MSGRTFAINSFCTSCGNCIQVCPTGSIFFATAQFLIDSDTCDGSAVCAKVCPVDAIHPKSKPSPALAPEAKNPAGSR